MSPVQSKSAALALCIASAAASAQAADDDQSGAFGISLPSVNNSAIGYGKDVSGAVSDKLYYRRRLCYFAAGNAQQHA